jgi:hypothetical protein
MSTNEMMLSTVVSIVQRYKDRNNVFPKQHLSCENDPAKEQELKDFELLNQWRHDDSRCPVQVINYLDSGMPGWRGELYYSFLPKAQHIVDYYNRKRNFVAPTVDNDWLSSKSDFKEYRLLCESKAFICRQKAGEAGCPPSIQAFLNRGAPNWLSIGQCKTYDRMDESFTRAEGIVERYNARGKKLPKEWRNHKVKHDQC